MRSLRAWLVFLYPTACVVALAACASIAGLEDPASSGQSSGSGIKGVTGSGEDGGTLVTPEGITISPTNLVIADRKCGQTGQVDFMLRNDGDKAADYEITVPAGSGFGLRDDATSVITPSQKGSVPPKSTTTIHVQSTSTTAGTFTTDILVVVAGRSQQVAVSSAIKGGIIEISPPIVDFGEVRKGAESPPVTVTLTNSGNEAVSVTGFSFGDAGANGFTFTPGSVNVEPGKTATREVKYAAASTEGPVTTDATPTTFAPTCGAPAQVVLKGTSVSQEVTVGPNGVNFGDHFCNTSVSGTQDIVVTNYSNQIVSFSVALQANSWYSLVTPASDTVPAAPSSAQPKTKTIQLSAKPVGATLNKHSEMVTVTVQNPVQATKQISAEITVYGAVLEIPTTDITGFASGEKKTFSIKNVGNFDTFLTYTIGGTGFTVEADDSFLASQSGSAEVTFTATAAGPYSGDVTIKQAPYPLPEGLIHQSGPLCVTPPKLTMSATIPP